MTIGSPDYGVIEGQANETSSDDILELASRLGAVSTINRTGQQIISLADCLCYSSSFWSPDGYGGYIMPSPKFAHYGRPSLKVVSGANVNGGGGITFNHLPFKGQQIGLEALLIAGSFTCLVTVDWLSSIAGTEYHAQLQINLSNGALSLLNAAGGYDSLGTFPIPNGLGMPFS